MATSNNSSIDLRDASKQFAIRMIRLYHFLTTEKKEFNLSKVLLIKGTQIGADILEMESYSDKDTREAKAATGLASARSSMYYLDLLRESGFISENQHEDYIKDVEILIKVLYRICHPKED